MDFKYKVGDILINRGRFVKTLENGNEDDEILCEVLMLESEKYNIECCYLNKWFPKEGEYCWFWNNGELIPTLSKFKYNKGDRFYAERKGEIWSGMGYTVQDWWDNCAPFIGVLPEINEIEKKESVFSEFRKIVTNQISKN